MCNPLAVVGVLAGANLMKKGRENREAKKEKKQKELKESEEIKEQKSTVSNPLIPDTFQAKVRIGDSRDFEATENKPQSKYSKYTEDGTGGAFGNLGGVVGGIFGRDSFSIPKGSRDAVGRTSGRLVGKTGKRNPFLGRRR